MEPRVFVVTVHYQSYEDCLQCMASVRQSTYRNWMHLILDNASPDDSASKLQSYFQGQNLPVMESNRLAEGLPAFEAGKSVLILHHENRGFAAGNNEVLRYLKEREDFVWLLNPDVRIQENTLQLLVAALLKNPKQLLGTSVYSWQEPERFLHAGGFRINWQTGSVHPLHSSEDLPDYIYGGALFTCAAAFLEAGLLPEEYFLYWEESHWCRLAAEKGYVLRLLADARVFDKVGGSAGRGYLAYYYYTRNGLRFMARFRPDNLRLIVFLNFARALYRWLSLRPSAARGILAGTIDFMKDFRKKT